MVRSYCSDLTSNTSFHGLSVQRRPLQYPTCQDQHGHVSPGGHQCKFNLTYDLELCPLPDRGKSTSRKPCLLEVQGRRRRSAWVLHSHVIWSL
jgi:hypothetical protein